MTKTTIALRIFDTLVTLAAGGTLIFWTAAQIHANWWIGFSIGFIGAGVVIGLVERIWRK